MDVTIRKTKLEDSAEILKLYKAVSTIDGGIIRNEAEISSDFIEDFLQKSLTNGLTLVATIDEQIVGEIHAYTPDIHAFQHLLTDLTIVVAVDEHGKGIGKKLFEHFLNQVIDSYPHILRVELFVRERNEKNVAFYEKLGFQNEGRQDRKIFKSPGVFDTPLHMAWFNPNYAEK